MLLNPMISFLKQIDADQGLFNRSHGPETIDYELVKYWLKVCEEGYDHHGGRLPPFGIGDSIINSRKQIRLIDVVD